MEEIIKKKVILVGDSSVGKTSILCRYMTGTFSESDNSPTLNVGYSKVKDVNSDGESVELQLWDTAGQEKFRTMVIQFFRDAQIALICFDFKDQKSIDNIDSWESEVTKNASDCVLYLVATKSDELSENEKIELENFLKSKCANFSQTFITSSKGNINIKELFESVVNQKVHNIAKIDPLQENEKDDNNCC